MENVTSHQCCTEVEKLNPDLTLDLITEILLRLPAKPLARFKCVSKSWFSLINSRPFILRHIKRTVSTSSDLHLARLGRSILSTVDLPGLDSSPPKTINLPFSARAHDADLIGSHHGLVCISDHPNFVALFSPTTYTYRVLPVGDPKRQSESHWVDFGFGYDPFADDYKVVRVDQLNGPGAGSRPREVRVLSLKEGNSNWRKLEAGFPHFLAHPKNHGKLLNNSLHWMATVEPPVVYDLDTNMIYRGHVDVVYKYVIVSFDLCAEKFSVVEIPDCCDSSGNIKEFPIPWLEVLGNNLVVSYEYGPIKQKGIDVWMMKESWVKLFTFPYEEARPKSIGRVRPLAFSEDGSEVLMEQNAGPVQYFWFNLERGEFRDVKIRGFMPSLFMWVCGHPCDFGAVLYVDTLVTLDNDGLEHAEKPADDMNNGVPQMGRIYMKPRNGRRAAGQQTRGH